jgi:hypothetical protein
MKRLTARGKDAMSPTIISSEKAMEAKKKALVARADDCIFCAFSEDFGNQRGGYQACILCYLCLPLDAPVLYLQQTLSLVLLALFTGMPISAKLSA